MLKRNILILLFLSSIPFLFYFLRADIIGIDGYWYLNELCGKEYSQFNFNSKTPVFNLIFTFLPCNIIAIKLVLYGLYLSAVLAIAHLGELFNKKEGWMAGLFAFLSPLLLWEFLKFEDDQFAFPILFWSMYFFFKAKVQEKHSRLNYAIAFGLVFLAGTIWEGSIIYMFGYLLSPFPFWWLVILILAVVLISYGEGLFYGLFGFLPNPVVYENQPFFGIVYFYFYLFFIWGARRIYFVQLMVFLALALLNARFSVHFIPLASVCVMGIYSNKKFLERDVGRYTKKMLIVFTIAFMLFWGTTILGQMPKAEHWDYVERGIQISEEKGLPLINEWELGYWIQWKDGKASHWGGGKVADYNNTNHAIVMTFRDTNCTLLETVYCQPSPIRIFVSNATCKNYRIFEC